MKIFFIGTVEFSLHALKSLISHSDAEIIGVATKTNNGANADYADLTPLCISNDIQVKKVRDINHPNNVQFISDCNPDVIYCFGWSNLIKKELLDHTPIGVVGFHPTALPSNRGWNSGALASGLKQTSTSFL